MKTLIYLLSLISLFTLSCCTPEEDPLAACKADPNCEYFECLVDGEKWTPSCTPDPLFGCDPFDVQYYKETGFLEAIISNKNANQSIRIELKNVKPLSNSHVINTDTWLHDKNIEDKCSKFFIDLSVDYQLELTRIDTLKFMLEGSLKFRGDNNCGTKNSIDIPNFRLKYRF